ncbi:unnamed protein product [Clonostachys solani]|uniref:WSC domain-containing protein n=1 Tax=Clonostachys solani TaxID=160281 RepID=A0A9P0ERT6_9HYPO|nr:unnamed protein product [Clonostachys solani]
MQRHALLSLLAGALSQACELPTEPISDTISDGFGIRVQNADFPAVNGRYWNLFEAGGGDQHLYLSPTGAYAFDLTLNAGVISKGIIHAVINGEYLASDNTTKIFMTERGDPRALFQPVYGCHPVTDEVQVELLFTGREGDEVGGNVCVRTGAFTDSYEFRYSPPGNTANDPSRPCIPITLAVDRTEPPAQPTPTPTSSIPPGPTVTPGLFADVTAEGYAFVGCAPEEGNANDNTTERTLPASLYASDALTNEVCVNYCKSLGFKYAGSEYSRECWCANSYLPTRQPGTTVSSLAGCNMACGGDASQYCGGAGWLSLYAACEEGAACTNAEFSALRSMRPFRA